MHSHKSEDNTSIRHANHMNFLFTGWGSHIYNVTMVRLTERLYRRVVQDIALIRLTEGKILDAGTGPGTLVRDIARSFPQLQVYGVDLSENMIQLARKHAARERLEEQVCFEVGNVGHLHYPDHSFDLVVSTISMHHWYEFEQPLRELYRVLRPGGRLWIYDFRFIKAQAVENALAHTPFAGTPLEHTLVRTGSLPFAFYKRFALQKVE